MQTCSHLLMIRPVRFGYNPETAVNNAFQKDTKADDAQAKALDEFDRYVDMLRDHDIDVMVVEDTPEPHTPDSIFPNNWVSFHDDGTVCLYPMFASNRRLERRMDILDAVKERFDVKRVLDFTAYEQEGIFLEGTGSMILDRPNKLVYACESPRTNKKVLQDFCDKLGYTAVCFKSLDAQGQEIYHTNVMMCVAEQYVVVCIDSISDGEGKAKVLKYIEQSGKQLITISMAQMDAFAGNMLQVRNSKGELFLVMSETAYCSLTNQQIADLSTFNQILSPNLCYIETLGGGSARCMLAEIFTPLK